MASNSVIRRLAVQAPEQLAQATGYEASGGAFRNPLGRWQCAAWAWAGWRGWRAWWATRRGRRAALRQMADALDAAPRWPHPYLADEPEGTVTVHLSDTLARRLAALLRGAGEGAAWVLPDGGPGAGKTGPGAH